MWDKSYSQMDTLQVRPVVITIAAAVGFQASNDLSILGFVTLPKLIFCSTIMKSPLCWLQVQSMCELT